MPSLREQAKELRSDAGGLHHEAQGLLETAVAENREMTEDETVRFDKLQNDVEAKCDMAVRYERQAQAALGLPPPEGGAPGGVNEGSNGAGALARSGLEVGGKDGQPRRELDKWARLSKPEYHAGLIDWLRYGGAELDRNVRALLQIDSDPGGGYIVISDQFIDQLIKAEDDALPLRGLIRTFPALRGMDFGAVSLASDIGDFSMAAGEATTAEVDAGPTFGQRHLKPYDIRRKVVQVSKALLAIGTRFDIIEFVAQRAGYKLATLKEDKILNGTGASEPLGMFVASDDGIPTSRDVSTDNTATTVTGDNAIEVQGTLKPAYQGAARWIVHRDYITRIRKLKSQDNYLWQPGLQAGVPNSLLGKPYVTSEFAPNTFTANLYVGLYGDFSWYWFAEVVNFTLQRLLEQYALEGQIGLLFDEMAIDGMFVLPEAAARIQMGSA